MHWSAVAERDPNLSRLFWEEPGDHAAPGGESWNAASLRAGRAIDAALDAHPGRNLIVVCHMGIILSQLSRLLALPPYEALSHQIDPLSVTTLRCDGTLWQALAINHLP
jgi:alpha-ribazole phosphatase